MASFNNIYKDEIPLSYRTLIRHIYFIYFRMLYVLCTHIENWTYRSATALLPIHTLGYTLSLENTAAAI